MVTLHSNGTWDLVSLPLGKSIIGFHWIYLSKLVLMVKWIALKHVWFPKAILIGSNYGDTFSLVAKIASTYLHLFMVAMCSQPLYQLDLENVFLYSDPMEKVHMEQLLGFVTQEKPGLCAVYTTFFRLETISSFMVWEFLLSCSRVQHDWQ